MRKQNKMKRGMAALLSGILAFGMSAGIVPGFQGGMQSVQAATGSEPSVTAYATKAQLMDSTFAPSSSSGTAANIGVLAFGKNRAKKTQEWYILGKDKYVDGDNTVIFTVQEGIIPLSISNKAQKFSTVTTDDRAYKASYGTYTKGTQPETVNSNHYGASELRAELRRIASDTACFSTAQQNLLNTTTITTTYALSRNDEYSYTNSDILYAPAFRPDVSKEVLRIGTYDQIRIAKKVYWQTTMPTWTRSTINYYNSRLYAVAASWYTSCDLTDQLNKACCAASNLNLTDVLFASSAEAAASDTTVSGEIAQGTAMTLRLNGDGKDIGTVTCNADAGQINATKGSTTDAVALVVQGNDGTNDWYYSKQISGTDNVIVNASDIATEMGMTAIDFTNCKIWMEVTEDSVAYAVEATPTTEVVKTNISSVEITGIDTPVSNTSLDTSAVCATKGVSTTAPVVTWTPNDTTAGYNTSYTASVTLEAAANYEFTDSVIVTINGNNASVTKNENGTLTVIYTFPVTAKDKLTSITAPSPITVANGTAYKDMNLPTQVNIVTEGNTVDKANVTWDTAGSSYDASVLTEQVVTLNGTVTCPETIDANGVALITNITITVSAAGIVGAPISSVESGTYTENQKVALESSTAGATIYYTTNGVEPSRERGTRYTGPITAGGMEGQSVTTTIKAIAVKNGMQDSEVMTFTYTIEIPKPIVKHTITATAGANGSISPSGAVEVTEGENQTFSITANAGYEIASLKVDGTAVAATTSYTFKNVTAAHTIEASFKQQTVQPVIEQPSITQQPQNAFVKIGERATFTVAATGTDLVYQWQMNMKDAKGFVDIEGANEPSYTTSTVDMDYDGFTYQCIIANRAGSVTSNVVTLTVGEDVTPPAVTKHIITATAGANGSISPSGAVEVTEGEDQTFSITANDGYEIASLKVDGAAVTIATSYTFKDVTAAHTIEATFIQKDATPVPTPTPPQYAIIDGANSSWTQNTDGSLAIRGDGEMAKFQSVKVDGVIVDAKNYTVTEGSTIITFKADYLQTLSVGTHTFEIVWTDGSASTNFTVKNNKADDNSSNNNNNNNNNNSSSDSTKNDQTQATQNSSTDTKKAAQSATNPKTEDTSNPALGIILLVASLAGAVGSLVGKKGGK